MHIHFLSESSAGQVTLMAYLPGYNLVCPDKSAGLQKECSPPQTHNSGQNAVLSILEAFLRNPQSILPPDIAV